FVKPLDARLLASLARRYEAIVTLEENTLAGGFGAAVYESLTQTGGLPRILRHKGLPDRFVDHGSRDELLAEIGLTPEQTEADIAGILAELPGAAAQGKDRSRSEGWLD